MTQDKIDEAVAEAKRFIAKAEALKARRKAGDLYVFQGCRESGAVRRASLDLTRALADLRKPQ
jgi:hypothetical protein